jgi:nucleotide-binding universal stress UspA family protein
MSETPGFPIRRILAAFGASTASPAALEGAVELAARLGAELEALFVEDADLLTLAELPVVRQVSLHGAPSRPVARIDLERELRVLARQAEKRLAEAATRRQIRCSFKVIRGHVASEVCQAAATADLLMLECLSRPVGRTSRVEVTARAVVARAARSVMLVPPDRAPSGPVHVVLEEGSRADPLLQAATELARRYGGPLVIDLVGTHAERESLQSQVAARLPLPPVALEYRTVGTLEATDVGALLGAVGGGTLVLDANSSLLESEAGWERVARAPCAVLLVR